MESTSRADSAQMYLRRRLENLNADRQKLENRINAIKYEADEIENKMHEINSEFDSAYEVFSPKPKDKGFDKKEIGSLQLRKNELLISLKDFSKEYDLIVRDISEIRDVLKIDAGEYDDMEMEPDMEDGNMPYPTGYTSEYIPGYISGYISGYDILEQRENERKRVSFELREKTVIPLDNLMHKCEICSKILEHDTARAKLELEIMAGIIKDTADNTKDIINYLNPVEPDETDFDDALQILLQKLQTDMGVTIELETDDEWNQRINMPSIMETTVLRTIADGIKGIVGFLTEDIFDKNKIYLFLKYEAYDFNGIYIVIENKNEENSDIENMEETDLLYDMKDDLGLFMIEENVYLLGGDVKVEASATGKIKIEITVPVPDME